MRGKGLLAGTLLSVLMVVAFAVAVVGQEGFAATGSETKKPDIVDTASKAENFKTLVKALTAAELVETLKGKGPFTVFAPDDAAFAKLPEGKLAELLKDENRSDLTSLLKLHVVAGKMMASDVAAAKTVATLNGKEIKITVKEDKVMIGNATITKTDIECGNGVIHVIDSVLTAGEKM